MFYVCFCMHALFRSVFFLEWFMYLCTEYSRYQCFWYSCRYCKGITDALLAELPRGLRKLYMSWCPRVSNRSLALLPPQLATLSLIGCHRVTDEGVLLLPQSLTALGLSKCAVSAECLRLLPRQLRVLDIVCLTHAHAHAHLTHTRVQPPPHTQI